MALVFDATVIVQGWHIFKSCNKIVGGASPNHFLVIGEKPKEELVKLLKFCVGGKGVVVASEVTFSAVFF